MHPETPPEAPSSDASNLDILRAFAVLAVFADHLMEAYGARTGHGLHPYDFYLGRLGVLFFFVHTSLVLMYSLARLSRHPDRLFARFYIRRAFRIYPLSIVIVLLVLLLGIPAVPWEPVGVRTFADIVSNLTLTMNLTHTRAVLSPLWSLPLEVQMYLVLPVLFLVLRRHSVVTVGACWLLSVLVALILPAVSNRLSVAAFGPCFVAGAVAFVLEHRVRRRLRAELWPVAVAGLASIYIVIEQLDPRVHPMPLAWGICLALGMAVPFFHNLPKGPVQRLSHQIATYSYGIYLTHTATIWVAFYAMADAPLVAQVAVFGGLVVALPIACFHVVEKPMMELGRRLSN